MSLLRSEMKLNETQMKATGATVEGLENKHNILEAQLKASESKTEALNQKVQKAAEIYGENSEEVTKLKTQLVNAQNAEEKLRQAVSACETELEQQKAAASNTGNAIEGLTDKVSRQQSELSQLKREYVDAVGEFGQTSSEAKELESAIENLSQELKQNKDALSDASEKADKLDKSLESADKSADGAGDGFTVLKGTIADLASSAIQMAIGKLSEFVGYLSELPAETMELRQDLATLTTSFDNVGFSTSVATDTWKDMYAIFGEDDRAVETSNLIAKMADNQKDLGDWTTITTGIWATYQDSLPVEGLAEASMETAKTGKVTGVLADALNWAGLMEDDFQAKLDKCSTEQERQQLITDTLNELYGEAAEKYRDTASAQMEAKDAAAEQMLVEAQLAETLQPVTTGFTELKTALLQGAQPAIEKVSDLMVAALDWAKEHPVAMQAIAAAVGVLAVGLTGLGIALAVYAAAQWAANLALAPFALPVLAIVAAIAALIAIIVVLVKKWDDIIAAVKKCWDKVKAILSQWGKWINSNVIQPIVNFFSGLWSGVKNAANSAWEAIKSVWSTVKNWFNSNIIQPVGNFFINLWSKVTSAASTAWNNVKNAIITPIEAAKNKVKSVVDAIKGFFSNLKLSLPKIKLPHFTIKGKFSLNPPSVPKLSIQWYKEGGIMMNPTIFGMNGNKLMAGGEAGPEAILPIDKLEGYVISAVEKTMQSNNMQSLVNAIEDLAERAIELNINGRHFATATAGDTDNVNGLRNSFKSRGLALD